MTPRAEINQKMTKILKKHKIVKISIKLPVCSERSLERSHGGGGGGGGDSGVGQWGGGRQWGGSWALPVYPVFENEKSKASDEKLVEKKLHKKDRED